MTDLLSQAIAIAAQAHAGQVDKAGEPYILHPLRVMLSLDSVEGKIVGVLHDVVEDTDISPALLELTFGAEIVSAILSVTRQSDEAYEDFIARAARNPLGRKVKLADIADNLSVARSGSIPAHLKQRYESARAILMATTERTQTGDED